MMKNYYKLFLILSIMPALAWAKCDEIGRLNLINTTNVTLKVAKMEVYDDSSADGLILKDTVLPHQAVELLACKPNGLFSKKNASGLVELQTNDAEIIALSYEFFQDSYTDGQVDIRIKIRLSNTNAYQVRIEKRRTWEDYKPIADVVIEAYQGSQ